MFKKACSKRRGALCSSHDRLGIRQACLLERMRVRLVLLMWGGVAANTETWAGPHTAMRLVVNMVPSSIELPSGCALTADWLCQGRLRKESL